MLIKYYGHSCFVVETDSYSICLDPYGEIGLNLPEIKADYYFCSHNHYDHNNYQAVNGKKLDSFVNHKIIQTYHDKEKGKLRGLNNVLILKDSVSLAHLGDLGDLQNEELIESLKNIDVLLCPIGGKYTIDFKEAIELINKVHPKIVIPMHYKVDGSNIDVATIDNFVNNVNFSIKHSTSEIDISNKDLLDGNTKIIILDI